MGRARACAAAIVSEDTQRIKRSMTTLAWRFNTDRMLMDYAERFYLPAAGVQLAEARQ